MAQKGSDLITTEDIKELYQLYDRTQAALDKLDRAITIQTETSTDREWLLLFDAKMMLFLACGKAFYDLADFISFIGEDKELGKTTRDGWELLHEEPHRPTELALFLIAFEVIPEDEFESALALLQFSFTSTYGSRIASVDLPGYPSSMGPLEASFADYRDAVWRWLIASKRIIVTFEAISNDEVPLDDDDEESEVEREEL